MNGLNGIIIDGKVYEVVKGANCDNCDCDNDARLHKMQSYLPMVGMCLPLLPIPNRQTES